MRRIVLPLFLLLATPSIAAEPPIGFTEAQLLQCAGVPNGQAQSGGTKVWQYSTTRVGGAVINNFGHGVMTFNQRRDACDAIVTFQNGRVRSISYRKSGGIITREFTCQSIFEGCR
jgi:hypothetical protein